ncbi:MAG: type II toxin-antitoxin system mRNA interferase toxin, RelE/StbE family [Leptonema illini]|uniref:Type II toxin-antitoxin system mRNA interferase toxin, RelE/StbE family n=1 Tax=Leptonema illini TaxID=183 RepID=A0A833H0H3_9LEPT|nr:MAG: type II toxin-antitoxin system mRNA interferase toxin, RelE/StbE family [Leptonema illini]
MEGRDFRHLRKKITESVYPVLAQNPFFGNNIKKLKGEFEGVYRYRIGDYRLFYTIQEKRLVVIAINIEKRKDAYR